MAKLKRGELKQIVKECLVEILSEGLQNSDSAGTINESRSLVTSVQAAPTRRQKTSNQSKRANPKFDAAVNRNVSSLTDDPLMASIFEDTARGTYQDQMSNETAPGKTSLQETAAPGHDLEDVFGSSAAQNWASLAFGEDNKKS